jgi:hypothetical protein
MLENAPMNAMPFPYPHPTLIDPKDQSRIAFEELGCEKKDERTL